MASKRPQFKQDEEAYWKFAKGFVRAMISEIDSELADHFKSKRKRQAVCSQIAFALANMLDQKWINSNGIAIYPSIMFSPQLLDDDVSLDDVQIDLPVSSVELHGMVADEIDWYFGYKTGRPVVSGLEGESPPPETKDEDVDGVIAQDCPRCRGTAKCFCIRKGGGLATDCNLCQGSGNCLQCRGTGKWGARS